MQKRRACLVHELRVAVHIVVKPAVVDLDPLEIVGDELLNVANVPAASRPTHTLVGLRHRDCVS